MPRKKAPAPRTQAAAPPDPAANKRKNAGATSHLFGGRAPKDRAAAVTSERIATDLDAFHKAGGRIEVLGTTRTLTRIVPEAPPPAPTGPKPRET